MLFLFLGLVAIPCGAYFRVLSFFFYLIVVFWGSVWQYENTPIQIYRKFYLLKLKIFR